IATKVVTVSTAPTVAPITTSSYFSVQVGHTITLSDATPGGVWSSNLPARASIDPATGVVTGISVPAATISYTVANGACMLSVTKLITVTAARPENNMVQAGETLSIYPNPTSGTFTVNAPVGGMFT